MLSFTVPQFAPKTLEELHPEADEVSALVYLEDSIARDLVTVREYNKDAVPLGQLPEKEEEEQQSEEGDQAASVNDDSDVSDDDDDDDEGTPTEETSSDDMVGSMDDDDDDIGSDLDLDV